MYCDRCGSQLRDDENFCHSCGRFFGATPVPASQYRVATHLRVLGVLWIVYSILHLIPVGVFMAGTMGVHRVHQAWPVAFLGPLMAFVGGFVVIWVVAGVVAGCGLLGRLSWARLLALVLGCLALLSLPFGTALGIYTLWVLLPARSEEEYRQLAGTG